MDASINTMGLSQIAKFNAICGGLFNLDVVYKNFPDFECS